MKPTTLIIIPMLCIEFGDGKFEITIGWLTKTYTFIF